jgi:hypothetical protein
MARTPQDFDEWFRRSGGDPWGYESSFVQARLDVSLGFISRHVDPDFGGTFIELGAFNGDFTRRIAARFPGALIVASDISPLAVEKMRTAVGHLGNVRLRCADIATFDFPTEVRRPVKVLLLECLYYLPKPERDPAVERLARITERADIFLSCPITGDPYPTERGLMRLFRDLSYRCSGAEALNHLPEYSSLVSKKWTWPLLSIPAVRRRTARQVIYRFVSVR